MVMENRTRSSQLDNVDITEEAIELWIEAVDNGIQFKIKDRTNMVLDTNFNNNENN